MIAEYELFLYAARHPAMMPTARRWLTDLSALVDTWTESRRATRTICAYIDGILLQMLVSGERPDPEAGRGDHPRPALAPLAERVVRARTPAEGRRSQVGETVG